MDSIIELLPEVVTLKDGTRIGLETAEAIMDTLHNFVHERPLDFIHIAKLIQKKYLRAARRELARCFRGYPDTVDALFAVLQSALVMDEQAAHLEMPYHVGESFIDTGGIYDQALNAAAHDLADKIIELIRNLAGPRTPMWLEDRRKTMPKLEEFGLCCDRGLYLIVNTYGITHTLVTPWGSWCFAEVTQSPWKFLGINDDTEKPDFYQTTTEQLELRVEYISKTRYDKMYALLAMGGKILPEPRGVAWADKEDDGKAQHLISLWQHNAAWIDPRRFF